MLLAWTGVMNGSEFHLTGTDGGYVTIYTWMPGYMAHNLPASDGFETLQDFDPVTPGEQRLANTPESRIVITAATPADSVSVAVSKTSHLRAQLSLDGGAGTGALQIYDDYLGTGSHFRVTETSVVVDGFTIEQRRFGSIDVYTNELDNTVVFEGYHKWTNVNSYQGNDVIQFVNASGEDSPETRANAFSGDGNDRIEVIGGSVVARFDGGAGDDTLVGGMGRDTLLGGEGSDWLETNTGGDRVRGGDDLGNDTASDTVVTRTGILYDLVIKAEDDLIMRGSGADESVSIGSVAGTWRGILVEMLGGNDFIWISEPRGNVTVLAGAGDDKVWVLDGAAAGPVVVDGGDGADVLQVSGTLDADVFVVNGESVNDGWVTLANVEALTIDTLSGDDVVRIARHMLATTVISRLGSNVVRVPVAGLSEAPLSIVGRTGTNELQLHGTPAADDFRISAGAIRIGSYVVQHMGLTSVQVFGGEGDDLFSLKDQTVPVTVRGGDGDDALTVRATNTRPVAYNGGGGADDVRFIGTDGDDVMTVGHAGAAGAFSLTLLYAEHVTVEGRAGNDVLDATWSDVAVTLLGGDGNDRLVGSERPDLLFGGAGVDTVLKRRNDLR